MPLIRSHLACLGPCGLVFPSSHTPLKMLFPSIALLWLCQTVLAQYSSDDLMSFVTVRSTHTTGPYPLRASANANVFSSPTSGPSNSTFTTTIPIALAPATGSSLLIYTSSPMRLQVYTSNTKLAPISTMGKGCVSFLPPRHIPADRAE